MDELQRLLAESAIRRVIHTRARAGDRRDPELALSCYHPGATEDHEGFRGPATDYVAQSQLSDPASVPEMYHLVGNVLVDLVSDTEARVESYCLALARVDAGYRGQALVGARYLDRFTLEDDRWAIKARTMVIDVSRCDGDVPSYADTVGLDHARLVLGRPDRDDPSHEFFGDSPLSAR
jgi:hypothetical protein